MLGYILGIVAGAAMSIQGVFNTRLSEKIGLYESNMFVQGTAFAFAIIAMVILGKGDITKIGECNKLYLSGGFLGIVITITVMLSMAKLTPALAVTVILISQLFIAALIDGLGLFGTERIPFSITKYIGLLLMIAGVIIFEKK